MDLMNNMGEYQTKESIGRRISEHYTRMSPEKNDSSREEGMNSLPEGEWAAAEFQKGMTQDKVKFVCQGATPWKTSIFLRGRVELFPRGVSERCWVPKRDDVGNEKSDYKTKEIEKESINILFDTT